MIAWNPDAVLEESRIIYQLLDDGLLDQAKAHTLRLEQSQAAIEDTYNKALSRKYIAPCLIDIGYATRDEEMVRRGTSHFKKWVDRYAPKEHLHYEYYNLANGYYSSWSFHAKDLISSGEDNQDHRLARHYYREAIRYFPSEDFDRNHACQVWTNYGNALDAVGRSIEAIDAYNIALRIDPDMGMALGNKAVAIRDLAPITHGYTHLYYLEAVQLLNKALKQPLSPEVHSGFTNVLNRLNVFLAAHGEMKAEEVKKVEPTSDFQAFLYDFCAAYGLFLNPATLLEERQRSVFGDPVFISTMYAPFDGTEKFDRYITFLNEIKQEFILGRYMLAQSQYRSQEIDAIDKGVDLFYPLDHSLHGSYIQLLKAAKRQAISIFDKIAYFIYDYAGLNTPKSDRVTFRQIWGGNDKMRDDLRALESVHLFALFSLSKDVSKTGDWGVIYDHRDALTHRFLVIRQFPKLTSSDIPETIFDQFLHNTILSFKITRAAIIYLILFIEHQEQLSHGKNHQKTVPFPATPMQDAFRYRP